MVACFEVTWQAGTKVSKEVQSWLASAYRVKSRFSNQTGGVQSRFPIGVVGAAGGPKYKLD